MGAWGEGILQNDTAQDGLVSAASEIERAIEGMGEEDWPQLLAGLGLLVQFSPYSLSAENAFSETLADKVKAFRPRMGELSEALAATLDAVAERREPAYDVIKFAPELETALHGPEATEFAMQKTWARPPGGCFDPPQAKAFLQAFAERRIAAVDADFAEDDAVGDLSRESVAMGDFALLLIVDAIHVDPAVFERWRKRWHEGREEPHPSEASFFDVHNRCVEQAFEYAIARFTGA
ncbi:MAG: hypothetical protein AAF411_07105 [Myxococcota bacterium]